MNIMTNIRKIASKRSHLFVLALITTLTLGLGACSSMDSDASERMDTTRTKADSGPGVHDHMLTAEVAGMEDGALMLKTKTGMETAQVDPAVRTMAMQFDRGDMVVVDYQHTDQAMVVTGIRRAGTDMKADWNDDDWNWRDHDHAAMMVDDGHGHTHAMKSDHDHMAMEDKEKKMMRKEVHMDSDARRGVQTTRTKADAGPGMHDHMLMAEVAGMENGALMLKTKTGMETAQVDPAAKSMALQFEKGDMVVVDYQHTDQAMVITKIRRATDADMDRDWDSDWDDHEHGDMR